MKAAVEESQNFPAEIYKFTNLALYCKIIWSAPGISVPDAGADRQCMSQDSQNGGERDHGYNRESTEAAWYHAAEQGRYLHRAHG